IIRRNGAVVSFEPNKIAVALMKAFLAVHGTQGAASASVRETVDGLTESVVRALLRSRPGGGTFHIEDVQDHVELGLMRGGHDEVHKAAILAARTLIEKDPGYTRATARLLLHTIRKEIVGEELLHAEMHTRYAEYFPTFIKKGVQAELLDEKLMQYDLAKLGAA